LSIFFSYSFNNFNELINNYTGYLEDYTGIDWFVDSLWDEFLEPFFTAGYLVDIAFEWSRSFSSYNASSIFLDIGHNSSLLSKNWG